MHNIQFSLENVSNIYLTKCFYHLLQIQIPICQSKTRFLHSCHNMSNYLFILIAFCSTKCGFSSTTGTNFLDLWWVYTSSKEWYSMQDAFLAHLNYKAPDQSASFSTGTDKNSLAELFNICCDVFDILWVTGHNYINWPLEI